MLATRDIASPSWHLCFLSIYRPPSPTLFPYTTLFRSPRTMRRELGGAAASTRRRSSRRALRSQAARSEEHTSELQSLTNLVCRLLLEKKKHKTSEILTTRTVTIKAIKPTSTLTTDTQT